MSDQTVIFVQPIPLSCNLHCYQALWAVDPTNHAKHIDYVCVCVCACMRVCYVSQI